MESEPRFTCSLRVPQRDPDRHHGTFHQGTLAILPGWTIGRARGDGRPVQGKEGLCSSGTLGSSHPRAYGHHTMTAKWPYRVRFQSRCAWRKCQIGETPRHKRTIGKELITFTSESWWWPPVLGSGLERDPPARSAPQKDPKGLKDTF